MIIYYPKNQLTKKLQRPLSNQQIGIVGLTVCQSRHHRRHPILPGFSNEKCREHIRPADSCAGSCAVMRLWYAMLSLVLVNSI